MSDLEPAPVAAFTRPAIKLWVAYDLRCAIYWGLAQFNGYVQLPVGHVDRELAEAYDAFVPATDSFGYTRKTSMGYGSLGHLGDEIAIPLTYGPDLEGWIGFDTGHGFDVWTDEEIDRWLPTADPVSDMDYRARLELMGEDIVHPGRMTQRYGLDVHVWTMDELEERVKMLARCAQVGGYVAPGLEQRD